MKYLLAVIFTLLPISTFASVVINEIAWMGTTASYNDEWIELYNNSGQEINLDEWILKAADGTPEIKLAGTILANDFYLLERTDDNTVSEITADQIYTGALGNNGEKLKLYDNLGNLIDFADASSGWPAGDNTTKQTMEKTSLGWQTSQEPGGTPEAENGKSAEGGPPPIPPENPLPISTTTAAEVTETGSPQTLIDYPEGVVINEIMPSPAGVDEEEEWIEILNQNNFEVDLSGWKISDITGKTETYVFPDKTIINSRGFLLLSRPATKITLNNQGDGLKLIQPDENIIDKVSFEKAPRGQSYSRFSGWAWTSAPTPGGTNASVKPGLTEETPREQPAAAGEVILDLSQNEQYRESSYVLLAAIILTAFSGTIIFIIKRKLIWG